MERSRTLGTYGLAPPVLKVSVAGYTPTLTRIFHEKCARSPECIRGLPERLFGVSPAHWPESNLLSGQ